MLLLASLSPRRKELISRLGIPFTVLPADVNEEGITGYSPEETVRILSKMKAQAIAKDHLDDIVLGADTVVAIDGQILGKPRDDAHAKEMLRMLGGRSHQVFSGFTICQGARCISRVAVCDVTFAPLSREEIDWYINSGEPFDKAGAYGIQGLGGLFVTSITGDYNAVVGLPLQQVYRTLKEEFGVSL